MSQLFSLSGAPGPNGGAGAAPAVKDTTTERFMTDVIEASMQVPVIVDFWAPWCGPCKQLGPILERLVKATNGAVRMVKLNIDDYPEIPTQLRVQSIPAVYAFKDGRPVDGFVGNLPESQVKAFIQRLSGKAGPSPIEEALEAAKESAAAGDHATAQDIYQQILEREPTHPGALVGLARVAIAAGDLEAAKALLGQLSPADAKSADAVSALAAIELAEQASEAKGATAELEARIAKDPKDFEARFELANAVFALGERQAAVDHLLFIIKADRAWNEEAARKQLLKLFEAMGPMDPLTVQTRKRLSAVLFS